MNAHPHAFSERFSLNWRASSGVGGSSRGVAEPASLRGQRDGNLELGCFMKSLFDRAAADEVLARIERLQANTGRQWGKMDVAQMLAHCSGSMDMALGKTQQKWSLLGRLIGRFVRDHLTSDEPMPRNAPTSKELKITDACDFAREQARLIRCVHDFQQAGEAACTKHPHPFFGPVTPTEWGKGMYKHLDHHLRQFGV